MTYKIIYGSFGGGKEGGRLFISIISAYVYYLNDFCLYFCGSLCTFCI